MQVPFWLGDVMKDKKLFTKDTMIGEVIEANDKLEEVMMGFGLHCFHCPMSRMETLGEACEVHDIDLEFFLNKLNEENK